MVRSDKDQVIVQLLCNSNKAVKNEKTHLKKHRLSLKLTGELYINCTPTHCDDSRQEK